MRILTTQKMIDDLIEVKKKYGSLITFNSKGFKKWCEGIKTESRFDENVLLDYIFTFNNKIPKYLEPCLISLYNYLEL